MSGPLVTVYSVVYFLVNSEYTRAFSVEGVFTTGRGIETLASVLSFVKFPSFETGNSRILFQLLVDILSRLIGFTIRL